MSKSKLLNSRDTDLSINGVAADIVAWQSPPIPTPAWRFADTRLARRLNGTACVPPLEPEDLLAVGQVLEQRLRRALVKHRAALEREHPVGEREHQIEVVLNDQDR